MYANNGLALLLHFKFNQNHFNGLRYFCNEIYPFTPSVDYRCLDINDVDLEVDPAIADLIQLGIAPLRSTADDNTVAGSHAPTTSSSSSSCSSSATAEISTENSTPTASVAAVACDSKRPSSEDISISIGVLIARSVQGSSQSLADLLLTVQGNVNLALSQITERLNQANGKGDEVEDGTGRAVLGASVVGEESAMEVVEEMAHLGTTCDTSFNVEAFSSFFELCRPMLQRLLDPVILSEEIKRLAAREAYGVRGKNASLFEDCDVNAIWRWETVSLAHFSKPSQAVITEARTTRRRYGRLLRAIGKESEQLLKSAATLKDDGSRDEQDLSEAENNKIKGCEEKSALALTEVVKAKEKRREVERKKAQRVEERLKKEEAEEVKRREREDAAAAAAAAAALKKASQAQEKEKKPLSEKELKHQAELVKQKSLFNNFFVKKAAPPSIVEDSTGLSDDQTHSGGNDAVDVVFCGSTTAAGVTSTAYNATGSSSTTASSIRRALPTSSSSSSSSFSATKAPSKVAKKLIDEAAFERSLKANMTIGEISRSTRERYVAV
jgi:hypothetical protein